MLLMYWVEWLIGNGKYVVRSGWRSDGDDSKIRLVLLREPANTLGALRLPAKNHHKFRRRVPLDTLVLVSPDPNLEASQNSSTTYRAQSKLDLIQNE